jgi:SAM-dependent methyltransferase
MTQIDQATYWNGAEGQVWAALDDRYDAMLGRYTAPLLDGAEIGAEDRVLDVGCGCGPTTRQAAGRAVRGHAHGIDLSAPMLARARQRAADEGLANVSFEQRDVQRGVPGSYDVLISRFGVMFFDDVRATFRRLAAALRDGGRLSFVCWRERSANENRRVPHAVLSRYVDLPVRPAQPDRPGAFSLADPEHVRAVLTGAGLRDVRLEALDEPLWFGADAADATRFYLTDSDVTAALADLPDDVARAAADELRDTFARHQRPEGVLLGGAAWLVTARR